MKLAISNIAWPTTRDREIGARMRQHGFAGVELAPTKYWPRPLEASPTAVDDVRRFWEGEGLAVVAMQSLLFGTEGLALFGDESARRTMTQYLEGIIRLGARLGAKALVFGSPKNRARGPLSSADAESIALPFFRGLGRVAAAEGTCLCIEPNPPQYACDWITTSAEALAFVRAVDSPGFGLHLDAAGMTLAGEAPDAAIAGCAGEIRHFHASEPQLAPLAPGGGVDHAAAAKALTEQSYPGWVSIEMRETQADPVSTADAAMARLASLYGRCIFTALDP